MPAEGDNSRACAEPLLRRWFRYGAIAVVAGFALFCALLLAVRFVVFPRVEDYRGTLTEALTRQLGAPVEMDRLATGWDGWNPKITIEGFRVRDRARVATLPLLELPQVDLIVAWTSLALLDLRLKELDVERPRLAVRRDAAGMIHVAGMEFDPSHTDDSGAFTDWLLHQPQIVVRDALITWDDDLRNAPQLVLEQVQFRLESRFGRHRFGLRGRPPAGLSAPIDVRGDVRGLQHNDWKSASGTFYARLDYADIAAWREWLPIPAPIESGKGALRMWFEFAKGRATDATADLELAEVRTRLAEALPQLDLDRISGRVGWKKASPEREIYAHQLAFVTAGGQRLAPTDFRLTLRDALGNKGETGLLEFEQLQLAPLRDLAIHLPLPERLRAELIRYSPRGTLTHGRVLWDGPPEEPAAYSASADFADLGIVAQEALPGVAQFTGHLEATQAGGRVKLATHGAAIDLPRVFTEPIVLDTLNGEVSWEIGAERSTVRMDGLAFGNRDAAGTAKGQYRTSAQGPGEIDLSAQLTRADVARAYRYIPLAVNEAVREWLHAALAKGRADDARLKLVGNLAAFPFADGKGGQFSVSAKARDVTLEYLKDWPGVGAIDADLRIDGARLTVELSRGRVYEVPLGKVRAEIPDLRATHPALHIEGEAAGPTADFVRFLNHSPIAEWTDQATEGAIASGQGRLQLKLDLPLGNAADNKVAGDYQFADNQIQLAGVPAMAHVNGNVAFTGHDMRAPEITAEVLGGAAKLAIASAEGKVRATGAGSVSAASLAKEYDLGFPDLVSGTLDWTIAADVTSKGSTWVVASSLKGVAVDLPAPLGKTASDAVALRVERRALTAAPNDDQISIDYGSVGRLRLHRHLAASGVASVDRALLILGHVPEKSAEEWPERPGLWVRGELPALNVDDWLVVRARARAGGTDSTPSSLELVGTDIDVGVLDVFGRRLHEIRIGARRAKDDWRLDLAGKELAGNATWAAPSGATPNGRVVAKLARLAPPDAGEPATWKSGSVSEAPKTEPGGANPWPEIQIEADKYLMHGRDVGRLEFNAHPSGTDWRIEKLTLDNDAGRLAADGWWRAAARRQQTKLDVSLDVKDVGAYLSRLGHADAIRDGPTKIAGQLEWAGPPSAFDYPTLGGSFKVTVGPGHFTKIEPGFGKLLGVLSLQSLPKRITLDFTDVFSEGFAFDQIEGDVVIQDGVMRTSDLKLNGPAAKVDIDGETDLAKETQRLNVRVQPTLSAGVSATAALLFLANPIIGAAVGAGSLLAQKVLRDPIEQMFSYQYVVTGSWSDPVVSRRGEEKPAPSPSPPGPVAGAPAPGPVAGAPAPGPVAGAPAR